MVERNDKVRRRLAAGKLRLRIRDLRNLGPGAEQRLAVIGIHSVEALRAQRQTVFGVTLKFSATSRTVR